MIAILKKLKITLCLALSATLSLTLSANADSTEISTHAAPQTAEELAILQGIYDLPGAKKPIPLEDFLPALTAVYKEIKYSKSDILLPLRQLNMSIVSSSCAIAPRMDSKKFTEQVKEIFNRENKIHLDVRITAFKGLLDQTFPGWDTLPQSDPISSKDVIEKKKLDAKKYFKRLVDLYFSRVDKAGLPRILVVGSGRYIPRQSCITFARAFPQSDVFSDCPNRIRFNSTELDFDSEHSYDEHYYGDARWDYFLLDKEFTMHPDICMDVNDFLAPDLLGGSQWDYIIHECVGTSCTLREERLLKKGGKILFARNTDLSSEKFNPRENIFGNTEFVCEKS